MKNIEAVMLLSEAARKNPGATAFDLAHTVYAELDPYDESPLEIKSLARAQLHYIAQRVCTSRYRIADVVLEKASSLISNTNKSTPGKQGNGNGFKR